MFLMYMETASALSHELDILPVLKEREMCARSMAREDAQFMMAPQDKRDINSPMLLWTGFRCIPHTSSH